MTSPEIGIRYALEEILFDPKFTDTSTYTRKAFQRYVAEKNGLRARGNKGGDERKNQSR